MVNEVAMNECLGVAPLLRHDEEGLYLRELVRCDEFILN